MYIHFPFCRSRCIYCDFYSTTLGQDMMAAYVRALEREMALRKDYLESSRVHTIYIGGGTPSLLPTDLLHRLFEAIGRSWTLDEKAEVTIEANPDDVTREWLEGLRGTPSTASAWVPRRSTTTLCNLSDAGTPASRPSTL